MKTKNKIKINKKISSPITKAAIDSVLVHDFSERSYLDYAMYVILNRALPHIADGLKPVQRRIIYAMSELGLNATAKYKKSARTVGDVLGKFHPHGDSACYEAMVLMAQPFAFRYPYIDGQGNWGSIDDPSSFAAMRYTEAKLSPFANLLLDELAMGTVTWQKNFDGTLDEPTLLPAKLPMALINGASGIAVGMATDIPPHNMLEVGKATIALLKNSKLSLDDLMEFIPAPDFASGCEIVSSREEIKQCYQTGNGTIRVRARYRVEKGNCIISALPYQVATASMVSQLASLIEQKKLPMIEEVRDESDREENVRIVIVPKSKQMPHNEIMEHLFATTDLEKSVRINFNVINLQGAPQVFGLKPFLSTWLSYRQKTVTNRLRYRLDKLNDRLHILDGLLAIYASIDEVIKIIRNAEEPKQALIKKFKLSEQQADAILEIRLRQLAKLEEIKIKDEHRTLSAERKEIKEVLSDEKKLKQLIIKELNQSLEQCGDERQCPIVSREKPTALSAQSLIEEREITIVASKGGWIRSAQGHSFDTTNVTYKPGDTFLAAINAKTNFQTMFLDTKGRAYTTMSHDLASIRGLGEPLSARVNLQTGATLSGLINTSEDTPIALASSNGFGFKTTYRELITKNKNGKQVIKVTNAQAINPITLHNEFLALFTSTSRILVVKTNKLPQTINAKGERLIQLSTSKKQPELLIAMVGFDHKQSITITLKNNSTITMSAKQLLEYSGKIGNAGKPHHKNLSDLIYVIINSN
ncbi:MAG: DNA topoisomerase IV subunit A [Methylacidiphilales bacterium]|nr:DNA topoisomerase IV subunit A [Candidatus Methylacidiphilales bacterium]